MESDGSLQRCALALGLKPFKMRTAMAVSAIDQTFLRNIALALTAA